MFGKKYITLKWTKPTEEGEFLEIELWIQRRERKTIWQRDETWKGHLRTCALEILHNIMTRRHF